MRGAFLFCFCNSRLSETVVEEVTQHVRGRLVEGVVLLLGGEGVVAPFAVSLFVLQTCLVVLLCHHHSICSR